MPGAQTPPFGDRCAASNEVAEISEQPYPTLFSPIEIGAVRLKNRVVHASISTRFADRGQVSDALIDYHANRARGGAAMIVTEPLNMHAGQRSATRVDVFAAASLDGLTRWADAVGAFDCHLLGQVQDPGRGRHEQGRRTAAIGPSPLPDDLSWTVPHALEADEIAWLIDDFATSCERLQQSGFSGVEISAGHGHLFHQFLSPWSNRRRDAFGGDLDGRTRLVRDLIDAIRAACGRSFVIGVKLPGEDGVAGSIDLAEAKRLAARIAATGQVDYWTFAWGSHADTLGWHLPDMRGPRAPYLDMIRDLRAAQPDIPTGALGLITDPNEGERALTDGTADLVMLGRPMITDPAWAVKAAEGREAQIRYCVSCNSCWRMIVEQGRLACDNNPRVGMADEADWWPAPARSRKRVVMVGGGIAGMEAAWVAAARGHEVTLFGASSEVGGKTRLHAALPGGENLSSIYDYQALCAERGGVVLELGVTAGVDDVMTLQPDAVVLATGARMGWPRFLPAAWQGEGLVPDLRALMADMLGHRGQGAGTAVIYDQDHTAMTYAAAEFLADRFDRVVLVTPRERIAGDEALVNRQTIYRRLYEKRVRLLTTVEPCAGSDLEEGRLRCANLYNGEETVIDDVALLTYATPRVPDDALAEPLKAAGIDVHPIGDCYAPRFVLSATQDGHRVGNAL